MASTAQDASAPLRGPEKKDEDRDEDGELALRKLLRMHTIGVCLSRSIPAHELI